MLVVDDNKVIRQLIRVNLELEGFEVVTAVDGLECLEIVNTVQPDLVLLDVVMPRLDGLRTAARLRADPRTRELPIAFVGAMTRYETETGCDVGVDGFLPKPFEPTELVNLVKELARPKVRRADHSEYTGDEPLFLGAGAGAGAAEAERAGRTCG
ncbi:PleD family two-component system response regulator [Streptomyces sp. NPDC093568]|uniref:response regulator n=1 Tax=Streptomyces sp. NPDC093568 TaxID=3366041 RepID=UPI0037F1F763